MAQGVMRSLAFALESVFGTKPAASSGKVMTRIEHTLNVNVDQIQSKELRTDFQRAESRNGFRKVEGDIKGELAAGQWSQFFAAALRGTFGAAVAPLVAKTAAPANEKVGKTLAVPSTGHTNQSFTFEDWFSDVSISSVYTGCRVSKIDIDIKPNGYAEVSVSILGQDGKDSAVRYFTSPADVAQSGKLAGVNGKLMANGAQVALITGMKVSIDLSANSEAVVGSNVAPDVYIGSVVVSGSFTCYFADLSMRTAANNDTPMSIAIRMDASTSTNSDYVAIVIPAAKITMPTVDDGEKMLIQDVKFTAFPAAFGAQPATSIIFQDTLA